MTLVSLLGYRNSLLTDLAATVALPWSALPAAVRVVLQWGVSSHSAKNSPGGSHAVRNEKEVRAVTCRAAGSACPPGPHCHPSHSAHACWCSQMGLAWCTGHLCVSAPAVSSLECCPPTCLQVVSSPHLLPVLVQLSASQEARSFKLEHPSLSSLNVFIGLLQTHHLVLVCYLSIYFHWIVGQWRHKFCRFVYSCIS